LTSLRSHARTLATGVAIYGAGDAAVTVVNFLLLPVYVRTLSPRDYGALLILISIETFVKIVNRWGLDGAFMRYYPDRADGAPRQRLTSTLALFLLTVDGLLLIAALAGSSAAASALFDGGQYVTPLRLMLLNTFVVAFTFVPFHVMRIRNEAVSYSALVFVRAAATTVLRLILVVAAGFGLAGMYAADLIVTVLLLPVLWPWARPLLAPTFSWDELRRLLRFGLPRLPHGLAQQAFDYGNRLILTGYVPLAEAGVYQNGATLGAAVKFFLASFETAWAPFYYSVAKGADAGSVLARMTTYAIAVLFLLVAGTTATARDLVLLMLGVEYFGAIPIVPLVALATAFQGVYLLTSIGLNLTGRTQYYPAVTFVAAGVGLGAGLILTPRFGTVGAATSLVIAFATQATLAFYLSRRAYRIEYEWSRLIRVVVAGLAAVGVSLWLIPTVGIVLGLLLRGLTTVIVYIAALWLTGFFRASERALVREVQGRLWRAWYP
jgi:O-antigen/teichoic acid export membrane protein